MSTLSNVIQRGLRSAQPVASSVSVGALYFVTDEGVTERSNGLIWEAYSAGRIGMGNMPSFMAHDGEDGMDGFGYPGPAGATGTGGGGGSGGSAIAEYRHAFVAPVNSQFSWVNQSGTAAIRDDTDSVVLTGDPVGNISNWNMRVKAVPATPYTITAFLFFGTVISPVKSYGLLWRNSTSGKLVIFACECQGSPAATLAIRKYTSPTVFSADYTSGLNMAGVIRWMRIKDDGTNRTCWVSADGVDWIQIHTIGNTDFIVPDQIGFGVEGNNSATPNYAPILRLCSWEQT